MINAPFLLIIFLVATAFIAPLIPMRRRRHSGLAGFPVVTTTLIAANLFFFAVLTPEDISRWGMTPHAPNPLTLLSYMFLHVTWGHILGNMLGLWLFGPHVEEALGRLEYLLFYLASGIAAGLFHLIVVAAFLPAAAAIPLVGASGALSGVLGIFAVRFWRARVRVFLLLNIPAVWAMSAFALLQIILGVRSMTSAGDGSDVAYWAHVGGFLFGLLIALPLKMREDSRHEYATEDAESALATGNLEKAAAHYRSVLAARPDDADVHHALGKVFIHLRQSDAAYRHLQEAIRLQLRAGHAPGVAAVYADAVRGFTTFPQPPAVLQRVASSCEETEQYPLAQHALAELCREHPQSKEAEIGLVRLGKLHLHKTGQPENAVGIFSEFLRLYPDSEWSGHAHRLREEAIAASRFGNAALSPQTEYPAPPPPPR